MDVEALKSPFGHFPKGKVSIVASPYVRNEKHQNSLMASPPRLLSSLLRVNHCLSIVYH